MTERLPLLFRPTRVCFPEDPASSRRADEFMKVASWVSTLVAFISVVSRLTSRIDREWPKRTVTLLASSILVVEASYSLGSFVNYQQLRHSVNPSDDDEYTSITWRTTLCTGQGALFQFGLNATTLLFLWFQYVQHQIICQHETSARVKRREPTVLGAIFIFSAMLTVLPIISGHIVARENFYGCWVESPYYAGFYGMVIGVLLLANAWCYRSVRWLGRVSVSLLGADRPLALRALRKCRIANIALVAATFYLVVVIMTSFTHPGHKWLCFLVSFDVLIFPFIFGTHLSMELANLKGGYTFFSL